MQTSWRIGFLAMRFRAVAVANPSTGNLPKDRNKGNAAFQVVGVNYAGPLKYQTKAKREGKAYIVLYACSGVAIPAI